MRNLFTPLLALTLAGAASMPADAQTVAPTSANDSGTLLNISAQAEARRAPDVAGLSAGVVVQASDANTALRQNAEKMTKVMAAIKAAGIAERDVQTSGINLQPQYQYDEGQPPKILGYRASNTVNLKVRDIKRLGQVLDLLAAQGASEINGPDFEVDQPEPVYDEARLAALQKAQHRAQTYAHALGLQVRRIVSISEGRSGSGPRPMTRMLMASSAAKMDTPVAPGENTLSVSLDVIFELGK